MEEFPINPGAGHRTIRFGTFEADLRAGDLRKNGLRIKIQEKPLQILALLLEHAGEAVTREELRERLWSGDTFVDFDHSLGTAMGKLRQALGDSAKRPLFIETLGGRGYRFISRVASSGGTPILPIEGRRKSGGGTDPGYPWGLLWNHAERRRVLLSRHRL